jgi:hypothetical protein
VKCVLNKKLYKKFHSSIKRSILDRVLYDNYQRSIIRKDLNHVFYEATKENLEFWLKTKKYTYKNMIFSSYAELLENLCIETKSTKCRNIIKDFLNKSGLLKNQHKKNIVKIINREWIN